MSVARTLALIAVAGVIGCASPEVDRRRGGGPGADVNNRGKILRMHEGSEPFHNTPRLIGAEHVPLAPARQAHELSRR